MSAVLKPVEFEVHATVTSKGQVTLPAALRERLGLEAGSKIKFIHTAKGTRLEAEKPISAYFGSLRHLGKIDTTIPKEPDRDFDYILQGQASNPRLTLEAGAKLAR
jgi:AbrB family looped-hinge helix DNA binding protein